MSASSPPSLPRAFLHSLYPHHPSSSSTSSSTTTPSSPGPLYTRLSNGSHSVPSPTNSRSSFHGVSFLLQIGLTRETVNLEASDLSLSAVKDLVCSIVDQKTDLEQDMIFSVAVLHICLARRQTNKGALPTPVLLGHGGIVLRGPLCVTLVQRETAGGSSSTSLLGTETGHKPQC
ncbi:hypothetical protein JOQ06_028778 [Pogonophryne albipinna]|uniref:Serine/threonine-protein kinase D1-3-like ubiquitin-like domain-containing protein n=1 Tax=Pogonophryne albipinna TaxID=1090488 RepID=A0AAD6FN82_9TELE|nr:hypothetical protein JOQ06_028778 [Pogonophryne albipinna]